jgi:hypothetical protein
MANVASMVVQLYREESDMRDSPGRGLGSGRRKAEAGLQIGRTRVVDGILGFFSFLLISSAVFSCRMGTRGGTAYFFKRLHNRYETTF